MLADEKLIKKITRELKNNTGNYRVNGKSTDGARWPEGNHFWIVDDMIEQKTHHIPVGDVDAELFEANNIGSEM